MVGEASRLPEHGVAQLEIELRIGLGVFLELAQAVRAQPLLVEAGDGFGSARVVEEPLGLDSQGIAVGKLARARCAQQLCVRRRIPKEVRQARAEHVLIEQRYVGAAGRSSTQLEVV